MVYVQDIDGKPMMPTTRHGKVRRLLKANKATVVNLCPFTIQLTYKSTDHKQPVTLGIDAGAKHIGFSATNGEQLGFWNVREYVLFRDGHKCSYCKGKSKDLILNIHHIESRKTGGDSPSNLITLCETCHKEYHKGNIDLKVRRGKSLCGAAIMGIMKWRLYDELKSRYSNVSMTFGYITKYNRIKYGIEKSHTSDAFVISKNFNAKRIEYQYLKRLVRRHNRQIHKMKILKGGKKKNNQAPFEVFGFRLFDKVLYNNEINFIYGRRKSGNFNIRDFNGENPKDVSYKKLKLIRGKRHPIILK